MSISQDADADDAAAWGQMSSEYEEPRYPQQIVKQSSDSNDSLEPGERFPEPLLDVQDSALLFPTENIRSSFANLNPVPVLQEHADAITKSFAAGSHELAQDPTVEGAVQCYDQYASKSVGVRDIGWHKPNAELPDPLIAGLSNGQLFALIRRFNKDVFAVRSVSPSVAQGLDLNEAWDDEYASDKITLHLQRFYLSIVLSLASLGKQVARLRSWKETKRTSAFCVVYSAAWFLDLLIPLALGTVLLLTSSETLRDTLFPPAPRALVNINTGGLQKPASGQLGTLDSLTGAPEKQQGEAVEEEAANFVDNLRHLVQKAVGMHENEKHDGDPLEGKVPKPVRNGVKAIKATGTTDGHATETNDQTQQPMEEVLWDKANPQKLAEVMKTAPHVVGEIVDNWERFANAISPTRPFSRYSHLRIDAIILPIFLSSFVISSYMAYKGAGLALGLGIFGDPLLTRGLQWLNQKYPDWVQLLQPKNNILRGVPTHRQLTLTLLRIGEVHNTPLPPVPTSTPEDADQHQDLDVDEVPISAPSTEKLLAIQGSPTSPEPQEPEPKHKRFSKITRFFKGNTKSTVETKLALDHVRAAAGSSKAKGHLGVLPKPENLIYAGPSYFKARYDGKQGWLYITQGPDPMLIYTTQDPRASSVKAEQGNSRLRAEVEIEINGIKRLKRATAFMSKPAEMAADWSSGKDLLGSVEVEDKTGHVWRFTAIPERDELFNRVVALAGQTWENL
ncbi:hypothetical protein QTJ16_007078 [Diplocarpon rosae]|uniref:Proteasome subunit beta type protein n=1 Tax=Diplocarpon rosae TaxID=946125 RepID=A0AAD9WC87_9HELO|nr:hypothetical protein QTJ16_007078 [Diplocarpon rosae]PBP21169.1 hypothetical protein BUE80_DR007987 [Diplocarpon rosae]